MATVHKRTVFALLIALAGLALIVVSLLERQTMIAALGGLVTALFLFSVAVLEKDRRN
jgi:hypothetical protein